MDAFLAAAALPQYVMGVLVGSLGFVFVPVFVLVSYAGVAVAWWRVRRAEKRDSDAGAAPWPRQRRWKRGAAWYVSVTALAVAVLLPCPEWHIVKLPPGVVARRRGAY